MSNLSESQRCPRCQLQILKSNLSRHIRERHTGLSFQLSAANSGDTGAQPPAEPSGVLQQYEDVSDTESSESDPEGSLSMDLVEEVRRALYARVATGILDQHHRYSEEALLRYLERDHPEVTRDHRLPLITGATVGAQFAAQLPSPL